MKKQILVVFTGALEVGGIERSLLSLLDAIDYELCDVDLFLYGHHGALFSLINPNVNLLPEVKELAYLKESLRTKIKNRCFYSAALRVRLEVVSKFRYVSFDQMWKRVIHKCAPKLEKKYDLALGFFEPFDFIAEKVDAGIRVGWVHTDYSADDFSNQELKRTLYDKFRMVDKIAVVSDQCRRTFDISFPQLRDKTMVIENCISEEMIKKQSDMLDVSSEIPAETNVIKILSIGRFSTPKNFDNVPEICRLIREKGLEVKWYLIGFGKDEEMIRHRIQETGMGKYVIILGKKDNPYPYIKACDYYIQPSRYEGKSVSVIEAQILNKPVIITDYPTSHSQLEDGFDGVIVPLENERCAEEIVKILQDKTLKERLIANCKNRNYSNKKEVEKIYKLMEEL